MSNLALIVIFTSFSVIIIFLLIKIFINKKKSEENTYHTKIENPILEEIKKKERKPYWNQLENLPIKVEKIDKASKELEKNKKIQLPRAAFPFLSEVVTSFYPVVQDRDKLKVVFTPEMMEQFKNGTAKMMKTKDGSGFRAMAVVADGKQTIVEHAKLLQDFDPTLVLNAGFHLASVVVAQQHMQQINESLKLIRRQLDDIKKFQINEYLFHAKGNIDYFETRIIPHFKANGSFDYVIRNQAEDRFNKTMDTLPNILSHQQDLLNKINSIRDSVFFGKAFGEEKQVTDLKQILNEYSDLQQMVDLYFKWLWEMYIPFLNACRYSDLEIKAVENRIKEFEDINKNSNIDLHEKVTNWTDSFRVRIFRFNEKQYIENSTSTVKAALPKPFSKFRAEPIIDGINFPLEMVVEYSDNEINTYLVEPPSKR